MNPSTCKHTDEQGSDLGIGVDAPRLVAVAGLVLGVLTAAVLMWLFAGTQGVTENEPTVARRIVSPASEEQVTRAPAPPKPQPQPRVATPQETSVDAAKKPAVPETPKEQPKPEVIAAKPVQKTPAPQVASAPAPSEPDPVVEAPKAPSFKRRSPYNEAELRTNLAEFSRELDIEAEKGTTKKLLADAKEAQPRSDKATTGTADQLAQALPASPPILELITQRADLKGLPMRTLTECQASEKEAKTLQKLSRQARGVVDNPRRSSGDPDSRASVAQARDIQLASYIEHEFNKEEWVEDSGVRMLTQMFQPGSFTVRTQLIKSLAATKGNSAGAALAQRAAFDLHPEVREAAVKALKDRPRAEYSTVLLEALRYPWAPVADHAAEAIVALKDCQAAFDLARLLDEPDPRAPTLDKEKNLVVPELVRVNHLANCVLCHSPSCDKNDPMRAVVPERGKALPVVYYESRSGSFVRADITYLKQDFSLILPVANADKWPAQQRFDYLIRKRDLTPEETAKLAATNDPVAEKPTTYPQREAVLWALRELTGKDKGTRSDQWIEYLKETANKSDP